MKRLKLFLSASLMFFTALLFVRCSDNSVAQSENSSLGYDATFSTLTKSIETMPIYDLDNPAVEDILFMREEEKLARDVYIAMYEKYSARVFGNISKSEQIHMNAIKYLIDRYELDDPVSVDEQGVFVNADLQELYNNLIEQGNLSYIDALKVGAAIEEIDILDLMNRLENSTDNADIQLVFGNLKRASGYHLKAFVRVLKLNGVDYQPQYLDIDTFNGIVNP